MYGCRAAKRAGFSADGASDEGGDGRCDGVGMAQGVEHAGVRQPVTAGAHRRRRGRCVAPCRRRGTQLVARCGVLKSNRTEYLVPPRARRDTGYSKVKSEGKEIGLTLFCPSPKLGAA